jgi:crossover junction endodeoxyribonuclease RuvC
MKTKESKIYRVMGIDPGLLHTGWGVIEMKANHLSHVHNGAVHASPKLDLPARLVEIFDELTAVIALWQPDAVAVEETFVNNNGASTLKLGSARAMSLLAPAKLNIPVFEYATNFVKKSVVGNGHAEKAQVQAMVKVLLPTADFKTADAADALAVAICHAHLTQTAFFSQKVQQQ